MSIFIKGGTGNGYLAKVDNDNRLHTYTTTRAEIAYQSEKDGMAFAACIGFTPSAEDTEEAMAYFQYTGNGTCHISNIIVATNSTSVSGSRVRIGVNPTTRTGGTQYDLINLNRNVNGVSNTVIYYGNTLSCTVTEANTILCTRVNVYNNIAQFNFQGGLILGTNDDLLAMCTVPELGDGCRVTIYFYEEED